MITANINDSNPYGLAFTQRKEIPREFIKDRLTPVKLEAMINKKKTEIEIHDFLALPFEDLYLAEMVIKTGTGKTIDEVMDGLVQRFGNAVKSTVVYVVLYKKM